MKYLLALLLIIFTGCSTKKEIQWTVQEREYIKEEKNIDADTSVLVVSRFQNTVNNKKYVQFKYYMNADDISRFISKYAMDTIESVKDQLCSYNEDWHQIEADEYFVESIDDLEIQIYNRSFTVLKLNRLLEENPNLKIVLTIANGETTFEEWKDQVYSVEQGTKDDLNIESKEYIGKCNHFIE